MSRRSRASVLTAPPRPRWDDLPDALTAAQVGAVLGVSANTVRRASERGELPGHWVGRRLRYDKAAVRAALGQGNRRAGA